MSELLQQLPSLGVLGLLFYMWWSERQERSRTGFGMQDVVRTAAQVTEVNRQLLDVMRANTDALAALREELRVHRATELELLSRLSRQLDEAA